MYNILKEIEFDRQLIRFDKTKVDYKSISINYIGSISELDGWFDRLNKRMKS